MRRRSTSSLVSPGTARADSAAQSREVGAGADQVRLAIAQLRELDLELAFAAARVAREDVEDEHRPVDDRQRNDLLEILALARTQIVEHQEQARAELASRDSRNLARLAAADAASPDRRASRRCTMRSRIRAPAASASASNSASSGSIGCRAVARLDGDDERAPQASPRERRRAVR